MMPGAKLNQVVDAGFPTMKPVPDVVTVHKSIIRAARETAAPVA
jgi:hypothetical protein